MPPLSRLLPTQPEKIREERRDSTENIIGYEKEGGGMRRSKGGKSEAGRRLINEGGNGCLERLSDREVYGIGERGGGGRGVCCIGV